MFCFDKDIFSSPRSPLNKRSIHRRSFLRQILQAAFLAGLLLAIFLVGRQYIWPRYVEYDSEELTGLVQKFCGKQQTNSDQQPSADQKKREYDLTSHLHPEYEPDQDIPEDIWQDLPVRGAFYMLVRNQDLQAAREAMRSVQDRFKNQRYPWVLLSNQDFSVLFRRYIRKGIKAPIYFGKIDSAAWEYPSWIDVPLAEQKMLQMVLQNNVYKGGSLSFHQLLRYQAGLFFHHPLFRNVEYVWRVEPGSSYSCDLVSDPFLFMKQNNKTLGFTLTMREAPESITSLWSGTQKFMTEKAHFVLPHNETIMPWIMSNQNEYNYCHMWSNFEIVDLNFLRSRAYQEYFGFLDRQGGFFYERWGDAPVRTLAAAMFLKRDQIHFFNDIGYAHSVAEHCPVTMDVMHRCSCDIYQTYDFHPDSCTLDLLRYVDHSTLRQLGLFTERLLLSDKWLGQL